MKSDVLFDADYHYNFDRDMFVNLRAKKAFSLEFVDDHSEETVRDGINEPTDGTAWRFYFNTPPSVAKQQMLVRDLERIQP